MLLSHLAFAQIKAEEPGLPLVVSSIRPLQLMVDEIGGEFIDSQVLLSGASSPHDFSLTIKQALMLSDADLLVWVGPKMESFLQSGVRAKSRLAMAEEAGSIDVQRHAHADAHEDPHLWLSEEALALFARRLTQALTRIAPQHQATFDQRLAIFLLKLAERHQANRALLAPYSSRAFAVYHAAYHYLVDAYGLNQGLSLTSVPHEKLSAKKLNDAAKKMAGLVCLLSETAEAKQAARYADLFEKPLVSVDLLAQDMGLKDFDAYLEGLGKALYQCLSSEDEDEKKPAKH